MFSVIRGMLPDELSFSSWRSAEVNSPLTSRTNRSTPTARTSGSANGSLISGRSDLLAIARCAATIVAVTPTLDARSQVSLSVRALATPLRGAGLILSQYNELTMPPNGHLCRHIAETGVITGH